MTLVPCTQSHYRAEVALSQIWLRYKCHVKLTSGCHGDHRCCSTHRTQTLSPSLEQELYPSPLPRPHQGKRSVYSSGGQGDGGCGNRNQEIKNCIWSLISDAAGKTWKQPELIWVQLQDVKCLITSSVYYNWFFLHNKLFNSFTAKNWSFNYNLP